MAITYSYLPNGGRRAEVRYIYCDTDAERPTSGLRKGDIIYSADTFQVYVATSATVVEELSGGGGTTVGTRSVSASEAMTTVYGTYLATTGVGGITLTLPAASAATIGKIWYVFKVDSGVGLFTLAPNGTDTLNGVNANKTIANQFNGCRVQGISATGWVVTSFTGL